jgi:Protein of unknown function (DUF4230)
MSDDPTREQGYVRGRSGTRTREIEPATQTIPGPAYVLQPRSSGLGRRIFWFLVVVGLGVATVLSLNLTGILPDFHNPFAQQKTETVKPPLLLSIQDLSRYVAAEGEFQVAIDLKEDRKYVPDFLLNRHSLYIAYGSVQAYVDFSAIGDSSIKQTPDGKTVNITLPAPQLGEARLDLSRSYMFAEERGIFDKIGDAFNNDPNRVQEVQRRAEEVLTQAATQSQLLQTAETNTRNMLTSMLKSLGFTTVTVDFSKA